MRRLCFAFIVAVLPSIATSQVQPSTQTARQALIEMFFGSSPDHLEKHLPDVTRKSLKKLGSANGNDALAELSTMAMMARTGGAKVETFDTGTTLVVVEDPRDGSKVEITAERDDLIADEDEIEVALHVTQQAKEQTLPFIPRLTFVMKSEAEVWRLSEISITVKVPLADPDFLKNIEDRQRGQNEQVALWGMRSILNAENSAHSTRGSYACSLSDLHKVATQGNDGIPANAYAFSSELASGKSGSYIFAISGCDGNKYKVVAEPAMPDSGQRAFCADEGGAVRSSADGKAVSCLNEGEPVHETEVAVSLSAPAASPSPVTEKQNGSGTAKSSLPQRVRVSQGVSNAMAITKVQPAYPAKAKAARVQGPVVMQALISKSGEVETLNVLSGDPLLATAAVDAVKQWKYRPYILNGNPVEVDTQITVNFTLAGQ